MQEIKLRYFNTGKPSFGFAQDLDSGEVKQYIVPITTLYLAEGNDLKTKIRNVLQNHLKKEIDEIIKITIENEDKIGVIPDIKLVPIFDKIKVRKKSRKTLKSLKKLKTDSCLIQYNKTNFLSKFIADPFNKVLKFLRLPFSAATATTREVAPVLYFAIKINELDLIQGIDELMDDLDILNDNGLIMGSLREPTIIKNECLSGVDGFGTATYTLFAFPIVNTKKANEIGLVDVPLSRYKDELNLALGLKHGVEEGAVSYLDGKEFLVKNGETNPFGVEETLNSTLVESTTIIDKGTEELWKEYQDNFSNTITQLLKLQKQEKEL